MNPDTAAHVLFFLLCFSVFSLFVNWLYENTYKLIGLTNTVRKLSVLDNEVASLDAVSEDDKRIMRRRIDDTASFVKMLNLGTALIWLQSQARDDLSFLNNKQLAAIENERIKLFRSAVRINSPFLVFFLNVLTIFYITAPKSVLESILKFDNPWYTKNDYVSTFSQPA